MAETYEIQSTFNWQDLGDTDAYARWRRQKLAQSQALIDARPVAIADLGAPTRSEMDEIIRRCEASNFAVYTSGEEADPEVIPEKLRGFAAAFALEIAEKHRSAQTHGIVALEPSDAPAKRGYIPYSTRALNWHTDGYYNAQQDNISAFVLHCVRPAPEGGTNQILDPEIAYIRLRDENPEFVRALMHPKAMTIPADHAADGTVRPASIGPVFFADDATGRMQMRYTARTRSIEWRDDPVTEQATAFLLDLLQSGDPLMVEITLAAGQGVLNNNVLHNRTGFAKGGDADRLLYRVRFHNRIARST